MFARKPWSVYQQMEKLDCRLFCGVQYMFSFVMENSCLRQLEFLAGLNLLDPRVWWRRTQKWQIVKTKKKKNPHVFFLSSCNEIFLACQICKNFDGKLGFSSSMHMVLRASHDQCANKRRTVFWVEGAFETKANGEWTSIVLLLLSQQLPEYFVEMDTNKMERK